MASPPSEDEDHGDTMAPRSHTDIPCCLFYILFMVGMGGIIVYSLQNGDPRRLTHGMDYQGRLCGVHGDVTDRPYLFWCRESNESALGLASDKDFRQGSYPTDLLLQNPICVEKCPKNSMEMYPCLDKPVVTQVPTADGEGFVVTASEQVVERASYPTKPFGGHYCIPDFNSTKSPVRDMLLESGPLADFSWNLLLAIGGLRHAPLALVGAAGIAVVCGYLYLLALKYFAKVLVYLVLLTLALFFLVAGIWFLGPLYMPGLIPEQWEEFGKPNNPFYDSFDKQLAGKYSAILGGVLLFIHLILVCVICCAHTAIETALGVIEAACDCMWDIPSMLLQPILEVVAKVGVFFLLLYFGTYLVSTGTTGTGTEKMFNTRVPGLDREFHYDQKAKAMIAYYVFGMFWCMELLTAIGQFIISYSVVQWYFQPIPKRSFQVPMVQAFGIAIFYHLGSLAFGAAIIAICRFARLILAYIADSAKAEGNFVLATIAKVLMCCVSCFKRFMEFVNKNAYTDICIRSTSFCVACKHTFDFIIKQGDKVMVLNGACFVFEVLGAFAISVGGAYGTFQMVTIVPRFADPFSDHYVAHPEVCAGVAFLLSMTIAVAFMNIFDHTADCLLYTFAYNKDHNHNSAELYCPPQLAELLEYEPHPEPHEEKKPQGFMSSMSTWFSGKKDEHEPMVTKGGGGGHH